MEVSINGGTPKSSILIGFSHEINHPFWGTPVYGSPHIAEVSSHMSPSLHHLGAAQGSFHWCATGAVCQKFLAEPEFINKKWRYSMILWHVFFMILQRIQIIFMVRRNGIWRYCCWFTHLFDRGCIYHKANSFTIQETWTTLGHHLALLFLGHHLAPLFLGPQSKNISIKIPSDENHRWGINHDNGTYPKFPVNRINGGV